MYTRKCTACNIETDKSNYKKQKTVCNHCCNRKERNNNLIVLDKRNNENNANVSAHEKCRYVFIGPSNSGETYCMLGILEKNGKKLPIRKITRSPYHYSNKETSIETKPIDFYKGSVVILYDMLGARNSSQKMIFFTRRRHEYLDVYFNSQSYFGIPKQNFRNNN